MGWVMEEQGELLFPPFLEGSWQSGEFPLETFGPGQDHER